jgi:hypothetical protein
LKGNKLRYEQLEEKLKASGEPQISTTDSDASQSFISGQVVNLILNSSAVDAHNQW